VKILEGIHVSQRDPRTLRVQVVVSPHGSIVIRSRAGESSNSQARDLSAVAVPAERGPIRCAPGARVTRPIRVSFSERRAVESTAAHRYVYSRARGRSVRRAPRFRRHLRRIVHELVNNGVGSVGCGLWRSRGYGGEREVSLDEKIEI